MPWYSKKKRVEKGKMNYSSCRVAIDGLRHKSSGSNVSADRNDCECKHEPTACEWVGNGTLYACLTQPHAAPQRVYDAMNGGKHVRIVDKDQ